MIPAVGDSSSRDDPTTDAADRAAPSSAGREVAGSAADRLFGPRKIYWRCFHCGEAFTRKQERWARQHFGVDESALPACQMRLPGEHHLLNLLRQAQDELDRYRAEDTELWRALYSQAADHAAALRREEERGYEKGLRDGRLEYAAAASPPEAAREDASPHRSNAMPREAKEQQPNPRSTS